MRPTERPPEGVRDLADDEVPDFLDAHRVALLAFLDPADPACARMDARIRLLAAKWEAAGPEVDPTARRLKKFGAGVVDVARNRLVAEAVGVTGVPTVLLFAEGQVADRLLGSPPEAILDEALRGLFARLA